ncbi:MAG: hypothetical protein R3B09_33010 [Nannocystaceae bacterium]
MTGRLVPLGGRSRIGLENLASDDSLAELSQAADQLGERVLVQIEIDLRVEVVE